MKTQHLWNKVRVRNLQTAIDPDAPLYSVSIPDLWNDHTAAAILQLCPDYKLNSSIIRTEEIIAHWLFPLCEQTDSFTVKEYVPSLLR